MVAEGDGAPEYGVVTESRETPRHKEMKMGDSKVQG